MPFIRCFVVITFIKPKLDKKFCQNGWRCRMCVFGKLLFSSEVQYTYYLEVVFFLSYNCSFNKFLIVSQIKFILSVYSVVFLFSNFFYLHKFICVSGTIIYFKKNGISFICTFNNKVTYTPNIFFGKLTKQISKQHQNFFWEFCEIDFKIAPAIYRYYVYVI